MAKLTIMETLSAIQTLIARWELNEIGDVMCLLAIQDTLELLKLRKEIDDAQKP